MEDNEHNGVVDSGLWVPALGFEVENWDSVWAKPKQLSMAVN